MYAFREGQRASEQAAQVVAELERIRKELGALKAASVVEAAADDASPLHGYFTWDDSEAADEFRLMEARKLIRSVVLVREGKPSRTVYGHIPDRDEGDYAPLEVIAVQPDRYLAALAEAREDLASAKRRVSELLEAAQQGKRPKEDIARIMLAVQALQTANEALAVH